MEIGNVTIHAELECSVSEGTLKAEDLIFPFLNILKDTPEYKELKERFDEIVDTYRFSVYNVWDSADMCEFLNEDVINTLNKYAPEGYEFGTLPGDGSDFGYWKIQDNNDYIDSKKSGKFTYFI